LLMVRFALEWFPQMHTEPPATALARAQQWLRTVTNRELLLWQTKISSLLVPTHSLLKGPETFTGEHVPGDRSRLVAVRGRANRFDAVQAQEIVQSDAEELAPEDCPYKNSYYWAAFQITGW
jgi:CHAT domain-containing protein